MDYGTAFKRPFTDGKKLLIGFLLSILPIVKWIVTGYGMECSGLAKQKGKKLPEWEKIGDKFVKGFLAQIIKMLYAIPASVILMLGAGETVIILAKKFITQIVPKGAIESVVNGSMAPEMLGTAIKQGLKQNWAQLLPIGTNLIPVLILAGAIGILTAYVTPMAVLHFIAKKRFSAAFEFKKIFSKAFTGDYFLVWFVLILTMAIAGSILSQIAVLGPAFMFYFMNVVAFTLFGHAYKKA